MANNPGDSEAQQFSVTRARVFLKTAIEAANKFVHLHSTTFDHASDSYRETQDQKREENKFRRKLKRKHEYDTKDDEVLQFLKKSKPIANMESHLPFIQKTLNDGMRMARLPPNAAVVPGACSVAESETGEYYAEMFLCKVYRKDNSMFSCMQDIYDFEKSNDPEMFKFAIRAFFEKAKERKLFKGKTLTKFPCDTVLKINSNVVRKVITQKCELHTARVPPGVTKIGYSAFFLCHRLQTIVLPATIESIEEEAFRWCTSLQSISIAPGIKKIGESAFDGNLSLQSIVLPASATILGDDVFRLCVSLTKVSLPAWLTSIPNGAFRYCINLVNVHLPTSVTSIGSHSFAHCVSLLWLWLPDHVRTISDHAFQACVKLSELTLPYFKGGKVKIGQNAFFECPNLNVVYRPASSSVYVVWALGQSQNRTNWQLTSIKRMRNVLRLITYYTVGDLFEFDPMLLSPCNTVPHKEVSKLIPIIIS